MKIDTGNSKIDTSLYALKKSMQVQEKMMERLLDSALKQEQDRSVNTHLGKYLDLFA